MKPLILFDFDGTIADSFPTAIKLYNILAKKHGGTVFKDFELQEMKSLSMSEFIKKAKIPMFRLPHFVKEFHTLMEGYINTVKPCKNIIPLIKKLSKSYTLGIFSSNSVQNIESFLKANKLDPYFKLVENYNKIFGKARFLKKFKPIIYIGDEVRDITAAKKAKIPIISVTWGFNSESRLKQDSPDFIAHKCSDIPKILNNLNHNNP